MLNVSRPRLWHPLHPNLYTLRTTILDDDRPADELIARIGIRHIRFDRRDGLFINGEKFFSIGANRHQDHPYVGYAMPDSAHYRDVKKLREAGFTSCRSHYPQSPAFVDACDELGMLAIVSNPGWQFVGDEMFQARAIHNARLMVRRDRNHPSVILWEAALNESDNRVMAAVLQRAVHEEYPGDQCFTAGDREPGFAGDETLGWDVEYLHNDGSKPYWIREWGDHVDNWSDQQSRSRVPRRWGEFPMLVQARSHAARLEEILSQRRGNAPNGDMKRLGRRLPLGGDRLPARISPRSVLRRGAGFVSAAEVQLSFFPKPMPAGYSHPRPGSWADGLYREFCDVSFADHRHGLQQLRRSPTDLGRSRDRTAKGGCRIWTGASAVYVSRWNALLTSNRRCT